MSKQTCNKRRDNVLLSTGIRNNTTHHNINYSTSNGNCTNDQYYDRSHHPSHPCTISISRPRSNQHIISTYITKNVFNLISEASTLTPLIVLKIILIENLDIPSIRYFQQQQSSSFNWTHNCTSCNISNRRNQNGSDSYIRHYVYFPGTPHGNSL